jgi:hypothetical protein
MDWEGGDERCHVCDAPIEGEPVGRGLLLFPRGDHVESEEPALCESCSKLLDVSAYHRFWLFGEEG